ncbi:hypothetical protein ElyMa_003841800 [Elysia marginata]|uniref:Uncharacterized protein n=1 Tax=Elysia marginata TaxID=1093978 RepID=A0AAV4FIE9_9GAST|nr:hypothetical protein ElyMa_003841800 [Elysia marginata]
MCWVSTWGQIQFFPELGIEPETSEIGGQPSYRLRHRSPQEQCNIGRIVMLKETQRLEGQNTTLRSEIRQLHEERDQLTRIIRSHASVCPLTPRHSPLTVVRESPLLVVPLRESPIITGSGSSGGCTAGGGCQGLTLIRESPLTTGDVLKTQIRESPLPGESNPRESPITLGGQRNASEDAQVVAPVSGGKRKDTDSAISRKSPRLIRESPLLAALAYLSSASASSQSTEGAMQCGHQPEAKGALLESHQSRKSPAMGMTGGMASYSLQSPVVVGGGAEGGDGGGSSGRLSRNGRRSSLLMQSPVMGGARPSVVMQSPALLVPPTRESPVPLLIINPSGGTTGGAGIGGGIGQAAKASNATITSPLPPSGRAVPSSPVPMTSRPRKSPIALFRGNPSPVHLCNPTEQRLAMDQSPILFGSPPKQSKHSIPPRLNLSGPKPVKPILPKPPSSSLSSTSSTASSSSFPCSSPRTPQSFMASPLPITASPVSATGRPSHASPVFFGEGCFTPSVGKKLSSSSFISTSEYGIHQPNKSPLCQADDASAVSRSPLYDSEKLRQSPMQQPDSVHHTTRSPLCILEAMRQMNQSPMKKPDVKRKLNQSPLCTKDIAKQHICQSPSSHMETTSQTSKSPAGCLFNSPSRADHSPMTVNDSCNRNTPSSASRITQQSPVFFGSGKGSNPPPSANNGQFLQPQPLPRSVSAYAKSPTSSLLTLLQRGNSFPTGRLTGPSPTADKPGSSSASNAFLGVKKSNMFHSNRGSGVFSTTTNSNMSVDSVNRQSAPGVATSESEFNKYINTNTKNNQVKSNLASDSTCSSSTFRRPDDRNDHEIIDVDEIEEVQHNKNSTPIGTPIGSIDSGNIGNFCFASNLNDSNSNNNSNHTANIDETKTHRPTGNRSGTLFNNSNTFGPTLDILNKNSSNATSNSTSNAMNVKKSSEDSGSAVVLDQTNSFNTARIFPDSPALPSPSILDDNALSLEEIERSAAVLEGRDDFMDLLDIQALLELSADHNSNNSGSNSNNFNSCDNFVDLNNSGVQDEVDIPRSGNQRSMSTACRSNAQIAIAPASNFNSYQCQNSTDTKIDDVNANNNAFVQHSAPTVFNPPHIPQENTQNSDTNFLFNIPPNSMQTDQDRYAQILASFQSLQNTNQNSTLPVMGGHLQSSNETHRRASAEQTSGDASGLQAAAQSALTNMGALGGLFVSSATSTIHHHPSQNQQSFLTPAQCQDNNYVRDVNSILAPSALTNSQNFLAAPQGLLSESAQANPAMCNQNTSFMATNQSAVSLFQMGQQLQPPHQSGFGEERYRLNAQWQPPLPRSTDALTPGLNRGPDQRLQQMAHSHTSDGSLPNPNSQATSGFSTYKSSRLRELLNAPTTHDVTNVSDASGGPSLFAPANNTPWNPSGVTQHSVWESHGNATTTSSSFSLIQTLESVPTPERNANTEQSSVWDPASSGSQGQTERRESSAKKLHRN